MYCFLVCLGFFIVVFFIVLLLLDFIFSFLFWNFCTIAAYITSVSFASLSFSESLFVDSHFSCGMCMYNCRCICGTCVARLALLFVYIYVCFVYTYAYVCVWVCMMCMNEQDGCQTKSKSSSTTTTKECIIHANRRVCLCFLCHHCSSFSFFLFITCVVGGCVVQHVSASILLAALRMCLFVHFWVHHITALSSLSFSRLHECLLMKHTTQTVSNAKQHAWMLVCFVLFCFCGQRKRQEEEEATEQQCCLHWCAICVCISAFRVVVSLFCFCVCKSKDNVLFPSSFFFFFFFLLSSFFFFLLSSSFFFFLLSCFIYLFVAYCALFCVFQQRIHVGVLSSSKLQQQQQMRWWNSNAG